MTRAMTRSSPLLTTNVMTQTLTNTCLEWQKNAHMENKDQGVVSASSVGPSHKHDVTSVLEKKCEKRKRYSNDAN